MVNLETKIARRGRIEVAQDDNGDIIISDNVTLNYGIGKTFIEAVGDYHDTLREWWVLTANEREQKHIDKTLKRKRRWRKLKKKLYRRLGKVG